MRGGGDHSDLRWLARAPLVAAVGKQPLTGIVLTAMHPPTSASRASGSNEA